MACQPCEARRRAKEEQARTSENLRYAPRPKQSPEQSPQQPNTQNQPASKKFQSPTVLPPIQ